MGAAPPLVSTAAVLSPAASAGSIPAYPRRAPAVRLCGRQRESGFVEPQWLVLRDGQFLQLPEPLYRILEDATGRRSLAAIAARLTKRTGRPVRVDTVRVLIARLLLPAGLLLPADAGTATHASPPPRGASAPPLPPPPPAVTTAAAANPRSVLALRLKRQLLSPRLIDPLTGVLQVFFWPPLLVTILLAAAVALHWLFVITA